MEKDIKKKPLVLLVGGLFLGDEGKGTTVDFLTRQYNASLVVRFGGGPQAMHHVVLPDGNWHCFSQFGAGAFHKGCRTLISKYMLVYIQTLLVEAKALQKIGEKDCLERMFIDTECFIVTPFHQLQNRVLEVLRGKLRYGTTGMGVGVTADDVFQSYAHLFPLGELFVQKGSKAQTCLQVKDLQDKKKLMDKLQKIHSEKLASATACIQNYKDGKLSEIFEPKYLETCKSEDKAISTNIIKAANELISKFLQDHSIITVFQFYQDFVKQNSKNFVNGAKLINKTLEKGDNVIFEGAQGALLDRIHGIYPHITRTLCTEHGALALLKEIKAEYSFIKIGVLRAFSSRHGNGPFVTNDPGWKEFLKEEHNQDSKWQGEFKTGPFDIVGAKYGIEILKPDFLAITCIDKLATAAIKNKEIAKLPLCTHYVNCSKEEKVRSTVKNGELFEVSENADKYEIKKILKRKNEIANQSCDLLFGLKDAKPVLIELEQCKGFDEKIAEIVENHCVGKLKYQPELSKKLGRFISFIQKSLELPIAIASFGPTYLDKISLKDFNANY